jgi:hypothetical protein
MSSPGQDGRSRLPLARGRPVVVATIVLLITSIVNVAQAAEQSRSSSPESNSATGSALRTDSDIARAIRFRTSFGLRADHAYVESSYVDPGSFPDNGWGIPLSNLEGDDLRLRLGVQESLGEASGYARKQGGYAGVYIDQLNHGVPVFLFRGDSATHRANIAARLPRETRFEVRDVEWSYAQLETTANAVEADMPTLAEQGIDVTEIGIRVEPNVVLIGVLNPSESTSSELVSRYGAAVDVVPDEPAIADSCTDIVVCQPMKAGIEIHPHGARSNGGKGYCTDAFLARYYDSGTHYAAVTAGHCLVANNGNANLNWYFNDPVTDGSGNKIGLQKSGSWYAGATADVGFIEIPSDSPGYPYPDDFNKILVKNSPLVGHITGTYHNADQPDHAQLCRIGYGQYLFNGTPKSCGQIVGFDKDKNSCDDDSPPNCFVIHNENVVDFDSHGGDSGAPYYTNPDTGDIDATKVYGIHTHSYKDQECENNPDKCLGWFSPIDSALGEISSKFGIDLVPCLNAGCSNSYTYP